MVTIWALLLSSFLYGANIGTPSSCTSHLQKISTNYPYDSAVEMETVAYDEVMRWLTTSDGTVGPIIDGVPLDSLRARNQLTQGMQTSWESLSPETQKSLIHDAVKYRRQDFWKNRKIPGLVVKPVVSFVLPNTTKFFGKVYPGGKVDFPLGKYAEPYVEFQNDPLTVDWNNVELKFRAGLSAGEMSGNVRLLQKILANQPRSYWDYAYKAQHVYVLAPLKNQDVSDPYLYAATRGEFFRRANLLAEMHTVVEDGISITRIASKGADGIEIVYFDSASQAMIAQVGQYFLDKAQGKNPILGAQAKMAWVGFRGEDYFDQPGLYGLEYRAVNDKDHNRNEVILDSIQKAMLNEDFGLKEDTVKKWLNSMPDPKGVGGALMGIYYNQPGQVLIHNAHPKIREKLLQKGITGDAIDNYSRINGVEIKMLVFNWGYDPMVAESPGLFDNILKQQMDALDMVPIGLNGGNQRSVVGRFLQNSRLYQRVLETFKIPFNP